MKDLITIGNISGYFEKDGMAYLRIEEVAKGLGIIQKKGKTDYIRWDRITEWLNEFNFPLVEGKDTMIPENIFYKLCFKVNNEKAKAFQDWVTDEVLPSIRKTGSYTLKAPLPSEYGSKYWLDKYKKAKPYELLSIISQARQDGVEFVTSEQYEQEMLNYLELFIAEYIHSHKGNKTSRSDTYLSYIRWCGNDRRDNLPPHILYERLGAKFDVDVIDGETYLLDCKLTNLKNRDGVNDEK